MTSASYVQQELITLKVSL